MDILAKVYVIQCIRLYGEFELGLSETLACIVHYNYNHAIATWLPSIAINKSKGFCCVIITDTRNRRVLVEENLKYEYLLPMTCGLKEYIANSFVKPC